MAAATAFGVLAATVGTAAAAAPIDVQRHWSGTAVNTLLENNVLGGRLNGRFQPDQPITREEVSSILYNLIVVKGLELEPPKTAEPVEEKIPDWFSVKQNDRDGSASGEDGKSETRTNADFQTEDGLKHSADDPAAEKDQSENSDDDKADDKTEKDNADDGVENSAEKDAQKDRTEEGQDAETAGESEGEAGGPKTAEESEGADKSGDVDAPDEADEPETDEEELALSPLEVSFNDISDSRWSSDGITYLAQYGIISGYPNGTFRPEESLTRKDFAVIVDRYRDYVVAVQGGKDRSLLALTGVADGGEGSSFTDVGHGYARDAIEKLSAEGILSGYSDGSFRPDNLVTRGEAAAVIYSIAGFSEVPVTDELPAKNVIDVPYISQVYPVNAPVGCEATALLMGLKGKGYAQDVGLRQFLDAMPKTSSNPAKGFVGSPYVADKTKSTRTTIYPPKLAEFASAYGKVTDFSGASLHELQAELLAGNPVVVYVTLWWEKPFYRYYNIEGERQYLLSNNHAVLVDGYDSETHSYHIADPYNLRNTRQEYRYWVAGSTFDPLYEERRHALLVE